MTNNDVQNITQKNKDRATRIPLKSGGELRCSEGLAISAQHVTPVGSSDKKSGIVGRFSFLNGYYFSI